MAKTSRQLVTDALTFNHPERLPRDLWLLPWAKTRYADEFDRICQKHPSDFAGPPNIYNPALLEKGNPFEIGTYTDPWGCEYTNLQAGIIGEVKNAKIKETSDISALHLPYETLPQGIERQKAIDIINRFCDQSDKFIIAGSCCKPWEQYQALRTTINAMMDIMKPEASVKNILNKMQEFYRTVQEFWAATNVDALMCMDDWGCQTNLLIPPPIWREVFKPLYKEYAQIAHSSNKFLFMHSDGCITEIYPDLIEIGLDAINSQLFCMNMTDIAKIAKGKITFWGEIDRQYILIQKDLEKTKAAVDLVAQNLYDPAGGIIAQFECGPGIYPPNAEVIYKRWEKYTTKKRILNNI